MSANKGTYMSKWPCDHDLRAEAEGKSMSECDRRCPWNGDGGCREPNVWCLMHVAVQCARMAIDERTTVFLQIRKFMGQIHAVESRSDRGTFARGNGTPDTFIWSEDGKNVEFVTDLDRIPKMILAYAEMIMCGNCGGDINALVGSCTEATASGVVLDLSAMQAHEARFGYNGGQGCDLLDGPCSCGAWHHRDNLI